MFVKLRYKSASSLIQEFILSSTLIIFLTRLTVILYAYLYQRYDKDEPYYYLKTAEEVYHYETNLGLNVTFAVILGIHALRVLYVLKASRTFGPMIEIIINMLKEV